MNKLDPESREHLAGEYVLGSLQGRARARFERQLERDAQLREAVRAWETRLHPLSAGVPPLEPPNTVWEGIEARLARPAAPRRSVWNSLPFWRGFGMAATALVLALTVLLAGPLRPSESHVVVVPVGASSAPVWVVEAAARGRFKVKTMSVPEMPPDTVCVLWLVWPDGYAQALGVLPEQSGKKMMMPMPKPMKRDPMRAQVAVTMERPGIPMSRPSEKMVFKGPWITI